jgi:shikimate 5-dehydrogenase
MVSIPTSPKGPTVYIVGESPGNTQLRPLVEIALKTLKFGSCAIEELQTAPDVSAADRGEILEFLQDEYNARGAFIAGQASQFLDEASDAYDEIDDACRLLGEVGVVVRRPGLLRAAAPRLEAATCTIDRILPKGTPELLILGANPDARAVAAAITMGACKARPDKVTIASTDAKGLADVRQRIADQVTQGELEIRHVESPAEHDRLLALMPPQSAVIDASQSEYGANAAVGSAALFPVQGIVCDMLSPAGKSRILAEAVQQRSASELTIHDGRIYTLERRIAILQTVFADDATDTQRGALRKALEKFDG